MPALLFDPACTSRPRPHFLCRRASRHQPAAQTASPAASAGAGPRSGSGSGRARAPWAALRGWLHRLYVTTRLPSAQRSLAHTALLCYLKPLREELHFPSPCGPAVTLLLRAHARCHAAVCSFAAHGSASARHLPGTPSSAAACSAASGRRPPPGDPVFIHPDSHRASWPARAGRRARRAGCASSDCP